MKYYTALVTVEDQEQAEHIANILLEEKLAACVNIIGGVTSFYWWEDKIVNDKEVMLIIKTNELVVEEMIDLVKAEHEYDIPEIIVLPIEKGNEDYLEWLDSSIKK
jgi:periplasmic divalent cation tolerance protein